MLQTMRTFVSLPRPLIHLTLWLFLSSLLLRTASISIPLSLLFPVEDSFKLIFTAAQLRRESESLGLSEFSAAFSPAAGFYEIPGKCV